MTKTAGRLPVRLLLLAIALGVGGAVLLSGGYALPGLREHFDALEDWDLRALLALLPLALLVHAVHELGRCIATDTGSRRDGPINPRPGQHTAIARSNARQCKLKETA